MIVDPYKARGKTLKHIYALPGSGYRHRKINQLLPGFSLGSFTTPIKGTTLILLDPYGDDLLPESFRERLLPMSPECVVLLCRRTGVLYLGWFEVKGGSATLFLDTFPSELCVPKHHLKDLVRALLSGPKRPYRLVLEYYDVCAFAERIVGFSTLSQRIGVSLYYGGHTQLQIMPGATLVVTRDFLAG